MTADDQRYVLKLNCSTCGAAGIAVWADHAAVCPGPGEIQVTRQLGHGLIVTAAPPRARMGLALLANRSHGLTMVNADQINIADQVLYQVVGYDPEQAALLLELVEDWRPAPTAKLSEAEAEEIKSRWRETYGKPGTAHVVTEIRAEKQPVRCWHAEPGSPCDWDVCRQPERFAAGDRGTDPARATPHKETR